MIRFIFDTTNIVDPAANWEEVSSTIKRDEQYNLFLLYQEYTLNFIGSGFDYIMDKITNDGFCTQIDITIQSQCDQSWSTIFNGIIFISDCEVNEKTCEVKCKVSDKSFFSKVNNNKNIKTSLAGLFTKNLVPLAAASQYDLDVYNVTANALVRSNVPCCRIEEAFNYFISFMTDSTVTFASSTFGVGGEWEGLCITTGERLRGVTPTINVGQWSAFNFLTLFQEINNRIPIILLVENPFSNPIIRIESLEYLYGSSNTFNATNIDEIITSYDNEKLYAIIKFGSPTDTITIDFPESIDFFGFKTEEFHVLGTCNLDQSLDLSSDWVVSSNIIQQVVAASQDYDKDIILINSELTDISNGRTTNANFLNVTPARYHYNELLNNDNISQRYLPELSNSMASFYVDTNFGEALGYLPSPITHSNFFTNEDFTGFLTAESFDYGNNFDTGTGIYTAPQPAVYMVSAQLTITLTSTYLTGRNWYQIWLEHYNQANVLQNVYEIAVANNVIGAGINNRYWVVQAPFSVTKTLPPTAIPMVTGDYLSYRIRSFPDGVPTIGVVIGAAYYTVNAGSSNTFLAITDTTIAGGVFNDVDPNNIKVQLHKFNYPMTQDDFNSVLNNPVGKIGFAMNNQQLRYGWIKELKYNHTSAMASFVLSTSKSTIDAT